MAKDMVGGLVVTGGWPASTSGKWIYKIVVRNQVHDGPKMTGYAYRMPKYPVAPGTEVPEEDMEITFFLDYLTIERGCSSNTIKGYSHDLYRLREFIMEKGWGLDTNQKFSWNNTQILHLRGFLAYLHKAKNNKSSSIHRRVCSIKSYCKYGKMV